VARGVMAGRGKGCDGWAWQGLTRAQ